MIDLEKLSRVLELASKTGRLLVAPEVADAMRACKEASKALDGIRTEVSEFLPPGTIAAVEAPEFNFLKEDGWSLTF